MLHSVRIHAAKYFSDMMTRTRDLITLVQYIVKYINRTALMFYVYSTTSVFRLFVGVKWRVELVG